MDHIPEELLDEYAMGQLPDSEVAQIEEHLLLCAFCQDRLELTDEFIAGLRSAAERRKTRKPRGGAA